MNPSIHTRPPGDRRVAGADTVARPPGRLRDWGARPGDATIQPPRIGRSPNRSECLPRARDAGRRRWPDARAANGPRGISCRFRRATRSAPPAQAVAPEMRKRDACAAAAKGRSRKPAPPNVCKRVAMRPDSRSSRDVRRPGRRALPRSRRRRSASVRRTPAPRTANRGR